MNTVIIAESRILEDIEMKKSSNLDKYIKAKFLHHTAKQINETIK